jgi:hypothetical protein
MGEDSATVPEVAVRAQGQTSASERSRSKTSVTRTRARTFHERRDAFLVFEGLSLFDQVDLVLEYDEVLELHDLHGCQVFRRLRLRARLVRGDEEKRGVHDRGAVQHGGHEDVMPGAVDERDVADELHPVSAPGSLAWRVVLLVRAMRAVVSRSRTRLVFAFVNLGVDRQWGGIAYCGALYPEGGGRGAHRRGERARTLALAYPSLIVIFRTSSFLKRTVMTPDIAFTTVDLPCATCPMVPARAREIYEYIAMEDSLYVPRFIVACGTFLRKRATKGESDSHSLVLK